MNYICPTQTIMKKILLGFTFLFSILMNAQSTVPAEKTTLQKKEKSTDPSIKKGNLESTPSLSQEIQKIEGKVTQVCEFKSCWILVETPSKEKFFIEMQDYSSLKPSDLKGKNVIVEGTPIQSSLHEGAAPKKVNKLKSNAVRILK